MIWVGRDRPLKITKFQPPLPWAGTSKLHPTVCCLRGDIVSLCNMLYSGGRMPRGGCNTKVREENKMQNSELSEPQEQVDVK